MRMIVVAKGWGVFAAAMLLIVGVALAVTYRIFKVSVTPNTPAAHSKLHVSAAGGVSNGLPPSGPLELIAQKGFEASPGSVPVRCRLPVSAHSRRPCPAGSKIGSGSALADEPSTTTAVLRMYLAKPEHKGDIASIVLSVNADQTKNVVGRLFKTNSGSVETVFPSPWKAFIPYGSFDLIRFRFGMHSLITNPSRCSRGYWSFTVKLGHHPFSYQRTLRVPCST